LSPVPEPTPDTPKLTEPSLSARVFRNHLTVWSAILIVLLALAAYWPALRGEFIWDDTLLVQKNPLVKGEFGLHSIWFRTDFPLSLAALWAQWLVWGNHPAGYHIVNALLHAANALLLWRVLERLNIRGAGFAAALFAVHPVCVASVAWISELKNTLSLAFFLLSFLAFLTFETARTEGKNRKAKTGYVLSLAAFLLALFSKTSTVMLPVVLLGCAWWQRGRLSRQDWLRVSPFFVLALVFGCLTIWFQHRMMSGGGPVQTENFPGRLAGAGMALWFYLGKALWPLNLNLIYPRWTIDPANILSWLPGLLWIGVLFLCWRYRRGWGRHALFALGGFMVMLFPVLGFFDMYFLALSRVSDHFQYLPLIFLVSALPAALGALFPDRVFPWVRLALIVVLSGLTLQRARVFASDETLWTDTLAKNPRAWTAQNNLGSIRARQGKFDEAAKHFEASLQINPENAGAHCNLAGALSLQGKFAEAEPHFQTALRLKPRDAEVRRSYASALAGQGRFEPAIAQLSEAVRIEPEPGSRLQLATLLYQTGRPAEAATEYRQVLAAQPDSLEALNNLAWLLAAGRDSTVRNGDEAVRLAERACRLTNYQQARTLGILGAAYAEAGRFNDAVAAAEKAVDLATAAGDAQFAGMNRQLLEFYRAGKAFHE